MDESHKPDVEWQEPVTKEYIVFCFYLHKFQKQAKLLSY